MKFRHLISELKRRNVFKVATIYGVTAWLLIQIAATVFPQFAMPEWTVRAVILFCAIGFPIALVLAWAYEVVPEKEDISDLNEETEAPPIRTKWLRYRWLMSVGLLGLLGFAIFFFKKDLAKVALGAPKVETADKSIAVLPFRDLSPNKDQQYLSDGMMIAILDRLIQIKELRTKSEQSVLQYKNSEKTIAEIRKDLNVAYLVEGDVQLYGDQIRTSVRLVDTKTEQPLWANHYDGEYARIFDFQNEIAGEITSNLNINVAPEVKQIFQKVPTQNTEAYTKYLKGYTTFWRNNNNLKATELFEQAIELDSTFASPYAELALMWMSRSDFSGFLDRATALKKAQPLLTKAIQLDPNDIRVLLNSNNIDLWFL